MKKTLFLLAAALALLFPLYAFAQIAKIVDLGGQVMVKTDALREWEQAKINMLLNKDAEVETKDNSYCTLAFDEEQKNIVTLKQNSRIRIDSIKPGDIFLPKGRVFSLIKNLSKGEKFQVRTPTAIAGARGTGWMTDHDGRDTSVGCFQDTAYVQGLDEQGNITGESDLPSGMGMDIGRGGVLGERYSLSDRDRREWNDFSGYSSDVGGGGAGTGEDSGSSEGALGDLRQEQRDDLREDSGEARRGSSSGGSDIEQTPPPETEPPK